MELPPAPPPHPDEFTRRSPLAIIGPGKVGCALALWAAHCGMHVRLAGRSAAHAAFALDRALEGWERGASREGMERRSPEALRPNILVQDTWEAAADGASAIFEALPEDLGLKSEAWGRLDGLASPYALRLTGSSSISLERIRAKARMASPLLGFHMFLPLSRMRVVELVYQEDVGTEMLERASAMGCLLRKRVVRVRDQAGYAASRMALAQGLEAMRILEKGQATAEDIDALMVLGYGHPCGPLELSDRLGLGLRLAIAEQIYAETQDPRFEPPGILRNKVARGELGLASGQGFHRWSKEGKRL